MVRDERIGPGGVFIMVLIAAAAAFLVSALFSGKTEAAVFDGAFVAGISQTFEAGR